MIEVQTAVSVLLGILEKGGASAAADIIKGTLLKGAESIGQLWRDIFAEKPESYPLADQVARNPKDQAKREQLKQLLAETLTQHPQLLQKNQIGSIHIGEVKADHGGIAVGVNLGGQINRYDK